MDEEIFLPITGHENYFISNKGRVLSKKCSNPKILKTYNHHGYRAILIEKKHFLVHWLVAVEFIPNPNNLQFINHKNENGSDNRVENLEWCTQDYNLNYGSRIQRISENESTEIVQCDLNGSEIARYKSMTEASKQTGVSVSSICINARLNKQSGLHKACGYVWRIGSRDHNHPNKKEYRKYWHKNS